MVTSRSRTREKATSNMKLVTLIGLSLTSLFLFGCGSGVSGPALNHGEFEEYFQRFETYSAEQGRSTAGDASIPISFGGEFQPPEVGYCQVSTFGGRNIYINQTAWEMMDDTKKEVLILHELGHCLLNREHNPSIISLGGVALFTSIMNPYLLRDDMYVLNQAYYLHELFNGN